MLEARFTQPIVTGGGGRSSLPDASNLSEHSFGFSASSSNHGGNVVAANNTSHSNSTLANALMLVNSNTERTVMTTTSPNNNHTHSSLSKVHQATTKHLQKVVAAASSTATSPPQQHSNSSHSQQTLVTRNAHKRRVVAESPPMLVHTTQHAANPVTIEKPHVARTLLGNATSSSNTKRKSQPKRKISTITDATNENREQQQKTADKDTVVLASPTKTTKNTASKRVRTTANNDTAKDRSNSASRSPARNVFSDSNNNSRSNPSRTNSKKAASNSGPPANNKSIHDFFTSVTNKKKAATAAKSDASSTTTSKAQNKSVVHSTKSAAAIASNGATATSTTTAVDWEAQCQKLQQQLQDKEEQLKAVTNNKTILHTALQSALTKTKQELQDFQTSTTEKQSKTDSVLEDLLRWRSLQHAKELRAKLAADGSRLGRVLYKRAGMRAAVESWEDGHATKDLQEKKEDWKRRMRALLKRQEAFQQNKTARLEAEEKDKTLSLTALQQLEAQEEEEAIEMHFVALKQEEDELVAADQALNDEKATHIRALKRVESEDSSRFADRPKLHDRYVLDRLLGKGGFSEVWRGFDLKELREVAVKIHQLDPRWPDSKKDNYTKHVTREYEIHRDVRHPRVVSLYDVFEIDANSFATVMECCEGTDLDFLLKSKKRLSERHARAILLQILSGMRYLSQPDGSRQGIIHYDLKPGNILFDDAGDAKITDFGLSKIVDAESSADSMELTSQGAGTYWYLPPECFFTGEQVRISNKVDVWSIGVIFYQMLYGRRPFGEGQTQDKILANCTMLNAQEVHFPEKPEISEDGKEFVRSCLTYDQASRPTIAQLCEISYVLKDGKK